MVWSPIKGFFVIYLYVTPLRLLRLFFFFSQGSQLKFTKVKWPIMLGKCLFWELVRFLSIEVQIAFYAKTRVEKAGGWQKTWAWQELWDLNSHGWWRWCTLCYLQGRTWEQVGMEHWVHFTLHTGRWKRSRRTSNLFWTFFFFSSVASGKKHYLSIAILFKMSDARATSITNRQTSVIICFMTLNLTNRCKYSGS